MNSGVWAWATSADVAIWWVARSWPCACVDPHQAYLPGMESNQVKQPKWALESTSIVVRKLIALNVEVTRKNYIELAYLGKHDASNYLPPELEMSLPEPLRMLDEETGRERKHL